ncbi:hypothetical protein PO909_021770, partial [Leuciscus waleckii]
SGSPSLWLFSTYIRGKTQFPKFSCTTTLDDITVGYYNSKTYIPRGNMTNEDDVIGSDYIKGISAYMYNSFLSSLTGLDVYQKLAVCELLDSDKPGKMIVADAARGSTTDELSYINNTFTYTVTVNIKQELIKPDLEEFKQEFENTFYPFCITTLKNYLKKRRDQMDRKITPNVTLTQKANSDSGGSRVSCLATGFYPRDLLPNGDGTYQMRKSLEISADKHKYSCSVTHLSLDNKLIIELGNELLQK